MGAAHQLNKIVQGLAKLCHPFRDILSKQNKFVWGSEHENAFEKLKREVQKVTENAHFNTKAETRLTCDASHEILGAVLEQFLNGDWKPIAYASRFLNKCEQRHSTNELELLAVVWSVENFRNYFLVRKFHVRTDHRALLSALKEIRGNKTQYSRLTKWVDRLIPFSFSIEHIPGRSMGWADYLSRHTVGEASPISDYDKNL